MQSRDRAFAGNILNLLVVYLVFFFLLLFSHTAFHFAYLATPAPAMAWLVALRYMLATLAPALALPALLYIATYRSRIWRKVALWFAGAISYYAATVLISDLFYYGHAGKHSTVELMLFYQNFTDIALMGLREYGYIPAIYIALGVGFFFVWRHLVRREDAHRHAPAAYSWWRHVVTIVLFVFVNIIAFRGGLQGRPLRPADAFQHLTQAQGDFALNGVYTSFYALFHRTNFPVRGDRESIVSAQQLIGGAHEKFASAEYPFLRTTQPIAPPLKKNVVFIILESWSAARVGILGDKTGATSFFDSIASTGWLFTNAFATGRRSIASLPSTLSSIPTLYGSLYITSPYEQNFQRGMGTIFCEQGYSTAFTYAAKAGSMGFNAFARLAGFEKILTRESFAADAPNDGTWGVYDHVMFARALADLDAAKKPTLSVLYTLHPHPPFTLPPGNNYYNPPLARSEYYNALRYSDGTLRDFFAEARKKPWFKDTVFVLMADHAYEDTQGLAAFRIPLLIYAPGFVAPRVDARVASELDVLPTLVELLHLNTEHAAMGKSLLGSDRDEHFAFIDVEHAAGIIRRIDNELVALFFGAEKFNGYYRATDTEWKSLVRQEPLAHEAIQMLQNYIGAMGYAVAKNKIATVR
ncbi:MAG: LTA synthase family protein [Spirochaetes bacterium]|nr:LTA synthase family protein [Spirochaetota bacterium]